MARRETPSGGRSATRPRRRKALGQHHLRDPRRARPLVEHLRVAGATVHFVTAELDHGPIIAQAAVPVLPDDDEDSLAARVLAQEHRILPQVVRWFLEGRLSQEQLQNFRRELAPGGGLSSYPHPWLMPDF